MFISYFLSARSYKKSYVEYSEDYDSSYNKVKLKANIENDKYSSHLAEIFGISAILCGICGVFAYFFFNKVIQGLHTYNSSMSVQFKLLLFSLIILIGFLLNSALIKYFLSKQNKIGLMLCGIFSAALFGYLLAEVSFYFDSLVVLLSMIASGVVVFAVLCIYAITTDSDLSSLSDYIFPLVIAGLFLGFMGIICSIAGYHIPTIGYLLSLISLATYTISTFVLISKDRELFIYNQYQSDNFKSCYSLYLGISLFNNLLNMILTLLNLYLKLNN